MNLTRTTNWASLLGALLLLAAFPACSWTRRDSLAGDAPVGAETPAPEDVQEAAAPGDATDATDTLAAEGGEDLADAADASEEDLAGLDAEPAPELPEEPPAEVTESDEAEIVRNLNGFFAHHDEELAEQMDGLKIYRGTPPEGEPDPPDRIPILLNHYVENWILYFTGRGQEHFERWLARLPRYKPVFEKILDEEGVPRDLVYLAMIESGFNPKAYSRARAAGAWQFMKGTGKLYKLRIDWWVDERRDPIRSARAAARYLKDLRDDFGSWYLAAAAYNAGGGKISRGLARYRVASYWNLLTHRYLPRETKEYVPKLMAAMILAQVPERFGFVDIVPESPLAYDQVDVPGATDIAVAARAAGCTEEDIKNLNPHLLRYFTPPEDKEFNLRIPQGTKETFEKNFQAVRKERRELFLTHHVQRGDTLARLAYMYSTDSGAIQRLNRIGRYIKPGQQLLVPVRPGTRARTPPPVLARASRMLREPSLTAPAGKNEVFHVVAPGDTIWAISQKFGVSVSELRAWNRLGRKSRIIVGDVVSAFVPAGRASQFASSDPVRVRRDMIDTSRTLPTRYKVRSGDTGYSIARKHGIDFPVLSRWNPAVDWGGIKPGDVVVLYLKAETTN